MSEKSILYPQLILDLQELIQSIPTIGPRNAEKIALMLALRTDDFVIKLIDALQKVKTQLQLCQLCNNISQNLKCIICQDTKNRNQDQLCIISHISDLYALENSKNYDGLYYILNGEINIEKNITPDQLKIDQLINYLNQNQFEEIIIATNPTINGDLTASYLNKLILKKTKSTNITRIAQGLPIGASINYADKITLKKSLEGRKKI